MMSHRASRREFLKQAGSVFPVSVAGYPLCVERGELAALPEDASSKKFESAGTGTLEDAIQDAVDYTKNNGGGRVLLSENLLPYDASAVTFDPSVRMIRKGQRSPGHDVLAYGGGEDGLRSAISNGVAYDPEGAVILVPQSASPVTVRGQLDLTSNGDLNSAGSPILLQGYNRRETEMVKIKFEPKTSGTDALLFESKFNVDSIFFEGDRNGKENTRDGLVTTRAGSCQFENVDIRRFVRDGIHASSFFINEFSNCAIRDNGRTNIYLDGANLNRFYGSKANSSYNEVGKYGGSDAHDVHIVEGSQNFFDLDLGNSNREVYAVRVEKGLGNVIRAWHDGGAIRILKFGENTTRNRAFIKGANERTWMDGGFGNEVVSPQNSAIEAPAVHPSPGNVKNDIYNTSAVQNANGWEVGQAINQRRVTEGIETGTAFKYTIPPNAKTVFHRQEPQTSSSVGQVCAVRFAMRVSRALGAEDDERIQFFRAGVSTYPDDIGGVSVVPKTKWQVFQVAYRITGVEGAFDRIQFRAVNIQSLLDVYITDVTHVTNPYCDPYDVPFIYQGTDDGIAGRAPARTGIRGATQFPVYENAPVGLEVGTVVMADGNHWDPTGRETNDTLPVHLAGVSLRSSAYQWRKSRGGTAEYYVEANEGQNPGFTGEPDRVRLNGTDASKETLGSLRQGEFGWGNNDSLGFNTVYVRLNDDSDPENKSEGWINAFRWVGLNSSVME